MGSHALGSPCRRLQDGTLGGPFPQPSLSSELVFTWLCWTSTLTRYILPRTASWSVLTSMMTMGTSPIAPSAVGGVKCSCVETTTAAGEIPTCRAAYGVLTACSTHSQPAVLPPARLELLRSESQSPLCWTFFQVLLCRVCGSLGGARSCPGSH